MNMKLTVVTKSALPADHAISGKKWRLIDAQNIPLGKVAVKVANILRGKDKPGYTAHVDTGDFVVVINAGKVKLTGDKLDQKIYYRHSGYVGNLKSATAREMMEKKPEEVIRMAVTGMMPKNRLSNASLLKLKIYAGAEHPHAAQRPQVTEL